MKQQKTQALPRKKRATRLCLSASEHQNMTRSKEALRIESWRSRAQIHYKKEGQQEDCTAKKKRTKTPTVRIDCWVSEHHETTCRRQTAKTLPKEREDQDFVMKKDAPRQDKKETEQEDFAIAPKNNRDSTKK